MADIIHLDELPTGSVRALWHPYNGFYWIGEYDITVDELLASDASPRRGRQREKAKEFLAELLAEGEVDSIKVYDLAEEQGIPRRTLERAKSEIGARSVQHAKGWTWTLD